MFTPIALNSDQASEKSESLYLYMLNCWFSLSQIGEQKRNGLREREKKFFLFLKNFKKWAEMRMQNYLHILTRPRSFKKASV